MSPDTSFDVIVIGVGSMGSSTCYYLAKRGHRVLGIEQFSIPHEQGSHSGQSRIIRRAYFEHPDYVPLLNRAYENWNDLEKETGRQVYYRTGLLYSGKPDNDMIRGVRLSASLYDIQLENLASDSADKRFPQFKIPPDFDVLFEPDAGFILSEKAILLYKEQAEKNGASIHTGEKVLSWKREGTRIIVSTDRQTYHSDKLVITAGAWAGKMIPVLADKIKVTRQFVAWLNPKDKKSFGLNNFPCWMIADSERPGCYYGFPFLQDPVFGGPVGLKIAHHYPGIVTDPDNVDRQTIPEDMEDISYVSERYLPEAVSSRLSTKTCLYANSPDENFIIDKLPGYKDQVIIASGFSGHGFKFSSVIGEILTDLAIEGSTQQPIGFLNAGRFSAI